MPTNAKAHILVVDDDPDFAAYLRTVLEGDQYTVTTASDGEEALTQLHATPPDLVTLDIQMPRKTGLLFYRQMKADPDLRSIPVIVISGLLGVSEPADPFIKRFFEVDRLPLPEAYLNKPVDKGRLLALVKAMDPILGSGCGGPQAARGTCCS